MHPSLGMLMSLDLPYVALHLQIFCLGLSLSIATHVLGASGLGGVFLHAICTSSSPTGIYGMHLTAAALATNAQTLRRALSRSQGKVTDAQVRSDMMQLKYLSTQPCQA